MRGVLQSLLLALVLLSSGSCQRRELTYNYNPTVEIAVKADWSDLSETPTGMSLYCYPESGEEPTVVIANISSMESSVTVSLAKGIYNILVFNQIPSDYSTVSFSGMDNFYTASIGAMSSTTLTALTVDTSADYIREPQEVAAATYLGLEVTEEAVLRSVELKSKGYTKAEELIWTTISLTPKVVIKNTQVKVLVSGIKNFYSAKAQLYGMATGYNFSQQTSHSDMSNHLLESWASTIYDEDSIDEESGGDGEITITFACFGLPGQHSASLAEDYALWEGVLHLDILLVDLESTIEESILLCDKITTSSDDDSKVDGLDAEANLDVNIDINITSGFGLNEDDSPVALPDVTPAGSSSSGFDATIDPWGDEVVFDIPI